MRPLLIALTVACLAARAAAQPGVKQGDFTVRAFRAQFADELSGRGRPFDTSRFHVILPDDMGHGGSSKPSDGLHARFPQYGHGDMVRAEHLRVTQGLAVNDLRVVPGTSMGCMHAWMWGESHAEFVDGLVPLACAPTQIAGRNRMMRTLAIDAMLAIDSADDEVDPPSLGLMERPMPRVAKAQYVLIPTSPETGGHGTHTRAVVWKQYLTDFPATLPAR